MINHRDFDLIDPVVDARGAGEIASESGLACVLIGLHKAPQLHTENCFGQYDALSRNNLLAVVAPASSLGGIPMMEATRRGIPLIAVKDNTTLLEAGKEPLSMDNVIEVENYPEAAGIIMALKKGISLASLKRPLKTLKPKAQATPEPSYSLS
jgi:hypothetical protein